MNDIKVLLINPTLGTDEQYGALARAGTELPQLGLTAIAESLFESGIEVKLLDTNIHNITADNLINIIKRDKYNVIGFSVYITTIQNALYYAEMIKEQFNNITTCVGGPQATLTPEAFHRDYIDYIFIGEADYSFLELLKSLKSGNRKPNIKGLLFNDGNKLEGDRTLNIIDDIEKLPFIHLDKYYDTSLFYPPIHIRGKAVINVVGSRGCPFKCTFCAAAEINGRKVRYLSADMFIDYLGYYKNKGFDSFIIYDDTFTLNRKRAMDIAEGILKRSLKIKWTCFTRVDSVDKELLSRMQEAGCYLITYGCESLNDKTLKMLKKGFTSEQCFERMEITKEAGIMVNCSFMLGLPRETKDDMLRTIDSACKTRIDLAVFPIFEPYPGTPIYSLSEKEGRWTTGNFKNRLLKYKQEVWVPNTISRDELELVARHAFRSFYFRPYFITHTLTKILLSLPFERKMRLLRSGADYFILKSIKDKKGHGYGSRFR